MLVRYADDLVALCHTRQQAEQVKARLTARLAPRGLTFNEDKTRIVHLSEGFDFLGFTVRHYRNPGKLLITPSKAAVKRFRARLRSEVHGAPAAASDQQTQPVPAGMGRTTGRLCPRGSSRISTPPCGGRCSSGADANTTRRPASGSWTATSDGSTHDDKTDGPSATGGPAPTSGSCRGGRSVATRWSRPMRRQTTRPWPTTGNSDGDANGHQTRQSHYLVPRDARRDLLEPDAMKVARPVLRWPRPGSAPRR